MLNFAINNEAIQVARPIPLLTINPSNKEMSIMAKNQDTTAPQKKQYPKTNLNGRKHTTEEIVGKRFGKLIVLEEVEARMEGGCLRRRMRSRCDCGVIKSTRLGDLLNGHSKSCGCMSMAALEQRTTHGLAGHALYDVWDAMKQRCFNSNSPCYHNYGGRGITICDEWRNDFKAFHGWAIENRWKKELDIDREDNDGDYTPKNCRFVTRAINVQNTRLITDRNTSGYRGISRSSSKKNPWEASIRCNGERYRLGYHKTKEEAAHAYDAKVVELGSEHPLNFPAE
jgi:hypothetical protein